MPSLIGLALAVVLTPLARHLGLRIGLVDRPGGPLKIHARPVPVLGGVAVVAATLAAVAISGRDLDGWLVAAVLLVATVGVLDDISTLPVAGVLLVQLAAGGLLALGGAAVDPLGPLGVPALLVLVCACVNGVNIVDGQDALAGGLAAIAAGGLLLAAGTDDPALLAMAGGLAGALAGFLVFNRPPARIFLGNSGPPAAGVILAVTAAALADAHDWSGLLAATLCLGVFAFEVCFTLARRIGSGAMAAGDRLHSYDLLSGRLGRGRVTLVFWVAGAAVAGPGIAVDHARVGVGAVVVAVVALAGAALGRALWARLGSPA